MFYVFVQMNMFSEKEKIGFLAYFHQAVYSHTLLVGAILEQLFCSIATDVTKANLKKF